MPSVLDFENRHLVQKGLPELQRLAHGDFTYCGSSLVMLGFCTGDILLLDKVDLPFQEITESDIGLSGCIQDSLDFLEACAEDSLLHNL